MIEGYDLPKTVAERNEALTDFWDKGYNFALTMASDQVRAEMRWQIERGMRGDPNAGAIVERLEVLANIFEDCKKPEPGVSVGESLEEKP